MTTNTAPLTSQIKHVVVLMFENRSFDNMLGDLHPSKKQSDYRGINGLSPLPSNTYQKSGKPCTVDQWVGDRGDAKLLTVPYPDPGELFTDMCQQITGDSVTWTPPTLSGFAANYAVQEGARHTPVSRKIGPDPRDIMHVFQRDNVSVTSSLGRAYAVCDVWHASGPVQTFPNRTFLLCGTPGTRDHFGKTYPRLNDAEWAIHGHVDSTTILELLDANSSLTSPAWKIYEHDYSIAKLTVDYVDKNKSRIVSYDKDFENDLKNGTLPTFTIIEPRYAKHPLGPQANSNHPGGDITLTRDGNPINVYYGEQLLLDVYKALYNTQSNGGGDLFEETLLIVTYDEHGGLYDHVLPAAATSPYTAGTIAEGQFDYDSYGIRVPTLLINPYITTGTIYRPPAQTGRASVCDHTSIISTLMEQFGLQNSGGPSPSSLTPRDASAPRLEGLIGSTPQSSPIDPDKIPLPPGP